MSFPISNAEWEVLDKKFGDLAHFAAWQLVKKNTMNNHTDDPEDIAQELRGAILKAGSYFKRQVYIENCIQIVRKYANDKKTKKIVKNLQYLWNNRTKHGASKQKFGITEERILDKILLNKVPKEDRPDKSAPLQINTKFTIYCKAITWNRQRSLGKQITKEKAIRNGMTSLSSYDYLAQESD